MPGHAQDTESGGEAPLSVRLADARAAARRVRSAVTELEERIDELEEEAQQRAGPAPVQQPEPSWREKLWTCPPETRLGIEQASEATGKSASVLYKLTSAEEIPFRKDGGSLVFIAGELRTWLREREETVVEGRMELDGETEYLRRTS